MGNVPISVVILAKNEAARIRDCIESARWADEVLVVDDGSTDDTVAIASSLGARVLARTMDLEGRHRNWAHAQAKHEWILSLDADERVTAELAEEITGLLGNGSTAPYEIYAIPRRNYLGSRWLRHGGWYPSQQVKLFKKSVFRWEETTVHPRALSDRPGGTLEHDLIHYTYRDIRDFVEKLNRQTTLEAQKWIADRRRVTAGKALWRTADRFLRSYIGKRGYRDGFMGFVAAVMGGMYQLLAWAKYRERTRAWRVEDVVEPFRSVVVDQERYDRVLLMSHLCAYRLAGERARGKQMLEIGCGSGYGAYYLAHCADEMTTIDMDAAVIAQAGRLFQRPNLRYLEMTGTRLAFPDRSFQRVGAFQVIEHIPVPELEGFLEGISRVLTDDGVFVASTLNVDYNRKGNPRYVKASFHEQEFTADEYRALLASVFPQVELYGLYPTWRYRVCRRLKKWGVDRWGPSDWNPVARFYHQLNTDDHALRPRCDAGAIDLIAICRKQLHHRDTE